MNPTIKARIESIRRGEVPEGYKRTKIGIVPNEWNVESLKSHLIEYRHLSNDIDKFDIYSSSRNGLMLQSAYYSQKTATQTNLGYKTVPNGYVTYRHMSDDDIFHFNINRQNKTILVSAEYPVFDTDDQTNTYFLITYLNSMARFRYFCRGQKMGGTRTRLYFNVLGDFKLAFPSISEQEKIAEILAGQDRVIALKEKLLAEKQKQKKYLMQQLLTGKKRLPGFSGEWRIVKLKEVLRERDEKNVDQNLEICSVAVQKGVVNQIEHLGRSFAASDTSNYNVVLFGDIVYTKSPTGEFPFGIIKQSQLDKVAVSPLYGVFKPATYALGYILHCYFEIPINTNNYLNPIIQKGAKNTINISNTTFLSNKLLLPMDEKEQTAIAEILSTADKEIELLKKDIEQEKLKKKSLMQLLLTGIVRVDELVS